MILNTILADTDTYSIIPVLPWDCNWQPNPQISLKWECDPPPLQGMVLGTRCHAWVLSSPPRVCSKEGAEAVPRPYGPWPRGL